MAPLSFTNLLESSEMPEAVATAKAAHAVKLSFNADMAAIAIALTLAALVRLDVLPQIGW